MEEKKPKSGFIIVNKPEGVSSFAVVKKVKWLLSPYFKSFGIKNFKIGHLGTLDPEASGVLVLLIGRDATRQNLALSAKSKVYEMSATFGLKTETGDREGTVIETNYKDVSKSEIESVLPKFIGKIFQTVPKYSAVHIDGVRAYELARSGMDFTPPTKQIEIFNFKCLEKLAPNKYLFEVECSTGTYIRALIEDLAKALETVAFCNTIFRKKVGDFDIKNSVINYENITEKDIIPIENVVS